MTQQQRQQRALTELGLTELPTGQALFEQHRRTCRVCGRGTSVSTVLVVQAHCRGTADELETCVGCALWAQRGGQLPRAGTAGDRGESRDGS